MTKKPREKINIDEAEEELEQYINETLRQPVEGAGSKQTLAHSVGQRSNDKLIERWRSDLKFQIAVLTANEKRLSYRQILCARIWDASGWPLEKIVEKLTGQDGRTPSVEQVEQLLSGRTYNRVPHVMVDLE